MVYLTPFAPKWCTESGEVFQYVGWRYARECMAQALSGEESGRVIEPRKPDNVKAKTRGD